MVGLPTFLASNDAFNHDELIIIKAPRPYRLSPGLSLLVPLYVLLMLRKPDSTPPPCYPLEPLLSNHSTSSSSTHPSSRPSSPLTSSSPSHPPHGIAPCDHAAAPPPAHQHASSASPPLAILAPHAPRGAASPSFPSQHTTRLGHSASSSTTTTTPPPPPPPPPGTPRPMGPSPSPPHPPPQPAAAAASAAAAEAAADGRFAPAAPPPPPPTMPADDHPTTTTTTSSSPLPPSSSHSSSSSSAATPTAPPPASAPPPSAPRTTSTNAATTTTRADPPATQHDVTPPPPSSWWARLATWRDASLAWQLENKGSVARDHLASERTFLAWLRTSLGLVSLGIAITQLFKLPALAPAPAPPPTPSTNAVAPRGSEGRVATTTTREERGEGEGGVEARATERIREAIAVLLDSYGRGGTSRVGGAAAAQTRGGARGSPGEEQQRPARGGPRVGGADDSEVASAAVYFDRPRGPGDGGGVSDGVTSASGGEALGDAVVGATSTTAAVAAAAAAGAAATTGGALSMDAQLQSRLAQLLLDALDVAEACSSSSSSSSSRAYGDEVLRQLGASETTVTTAPGTLGPLPDLAKVGKPIGATCVLLGALCLVLGAYRYFHVQRRLVEGVYPPSRLEVALVGCLVGVLTVASFAAVVAVRAG